MVRTAFFLLATLFACLAYAQEEPPFVVEVFPEAPTSATPVTVFITRSGCPTEFLGRTGSTLRFVQGEICVLPPVNPDQHFVGSLPAGTYTIRIEYVDDGPQVFETTFVVVAAAAPAEVPSLDLFGSIVLAVMLTAVAVRRVLP